MRRFVLAQESGVTEQLLTAEDDELLLQNHLRRQFPQLSPRQLEIVTHEVHGRGEREIAQELCIAATTVHVHIKQLYSRVGVRSRGKLLGEIIKQLAKRIPPELTASVQEMRDSKVARVRAAINAPP